VRPSLRFLVFAVVGWTGLRAATLGALPGAELFRIDASEAKVPAIAPTQFPPIDALAAAEEEPAPHPAGATASQGSALVARPAVMPVYYVSGPPAPQPPPTPLVDGLREPRAQFFPTVPELDEWPLSRMAAVSRPHSQSVVVPPPESVPEPLDPGRIDRLQLTAWALLRAQSTGIAGTRSLASQGSLGASQAGARLTYNFTRQIAAAFRMTNDVGRRGGEVAAGVRVQPLAAVPLWIDAERRQRVGRYGGGRSAFALFFEAGLWDRPMPLHLLLNAYLQGGVVGARSRERFIDGELTLTRPVYKQFSAGIGVWGGAQRGVYRVDAGPRVTMRVRNNLRVHFDWRQRLAGNARPGSGPAVTLAGDF